MDGRISYQWDHGRAKNQKPGFSGHENQGFLVTKWQEISSWTLKGYVKSSTLREAKFTEISYFSELDHEIYRECNLFSYFSDEIKNFLPSHFLTWSRSEILNIVPNCGFLNF